MLEQAVAPLVTELKEVTQAAGRGLSGAGWQVAGALAGRGHVGGPWSGRGGGGGRGLVCEPEWAGAGSGT